MDAMERLLGVLRRLSIVGVWVLGFLFAVYAVNEPAWHENVGWRQVMLLLSSFMLTAACIGIVNWIFTGHWEPKDLEKRKYTEDPE